MNIISLPFTDTYRHAMLAHYSRIPNSQFSLPDELKILQYQEYCSGKNGVFRNRFMALIDANDDLAAMEAWLSHVGNKSSQTQRAYRKEAERFILWAVYEKGEPISGMKIDYLREYELFLSNPVSKFGLNWISQKVKNKSTGKNNRRVSSKAQKADSFKRIKDEWAPFDGALSPQSIDYTMNVLKSMYSYLTQVGYMAVNPLKTRKNISPDNKNQSNKRYLTEETWKFLFHFIESMEDRIPPDATPLQKLRIQRLCNQRILIFASLYLLGVRISELLNIKMRDFFKRVSPKTRTMSYWVNITGKGNKTREIPVSDDLMFYIKKHREFINSTSEHLLADDKNNNGGLLLTEPLYTDDTPLILSKTGTKPLSTTTLFKAVKETLADTLSFYHERLLAGDDLKAVFPEQLEKASTHWMRHTSATHQSACGVSLKYIKEFLGHSDFNTTLIYDHADMDDWEKEIKSFTI